MSKVVKILKSMVEAEIHKQKLKEDICKLNQLQKQLNRELWDTGRCPGTDGDTISIEIDNKIWLINIGFPDEGTGQSSVKQSSAYRVVGNEIIEP